MNKIYALSDDILTPPKTIFVQIKEILENNIKIIQYRSKINNHDEVLLKSLVNLCNDYKASFIINDDVLLTKKVNAHGVHIGKDDGSLKEAREVLGNDKIIGVSCYSDINLAKQAQENGANYVAFGAMYQSKTKQDAKICPHDVIKIAKEQLTIPICVIGGIDASNIQEIMLLNPDYIALVSAIYKPQSITQNLNNLKIKGNMQ